MLVQKTVVTLSAHTAALLSTLEVHSPIMLIIHLGANNLACSWVWGIQRHMVIPD